MLDDGTPKTEIASVPGIGRAPLYRHLERTAHIRSGEPTTKLTGPKTDVFLAEESAPGLQPPRKAVAELIETAVSRLHCV